MQQPAVEPTTIDLILANTDAERLRLEKRLHMTQDEMVNFFFNVFLEGGLIAPSGGAQTAKQRLEAVRQVIRAKHSTGTTKGRFNVV